MAGARKREMWVSSLEKRRLRYEVNDCTASPTVDYKAKGAGGSSDKPAEILSFEGNERTEMRNCEWELGERKDVRRLREAVWPTTNGWLRARAVVHQTQSRGDWSQRANLRGEIPRKTAQVGRVAQDCQKGRVYEVAICEFHTEGKGGGSRAVLRIKTGRESNDG